MSVSDDTLRQYTRNAANHFDSPEAVLADDALSTGQKRQILESWMVDEKELITATDENMGSGDTNRLQQVMDALSALENSGR